MKPLVPISDSFASVFQLCSSTYMKNDLKERLEKIFAHTINIDKLYKDYAHLGNLHKFPKDILSNKGVSEKEFEYIYNEKLLAKGAVGRDVYMRIKNLCMVYDNRCPSCAKREVSTLDHFLPKSIFPHLSVSPLNLVPCCYECNKTKGTYIPTCGEEELIHPYFDNIDEHCWLTAEITGTIYPVVEFKIVQPEPWSTLLYTRVKNHFDTYDLESLYVSNAMNSLNSHKKGFKILRSQNNGIDVLKEHIDLLYVSFREHNLNSWETALFRALLHNEEFFNSSFCT